MLREIIFSLSISKIYTLFYRYSVLANLILFLYNLYMRGIHQRHPLDSRLFRSLPILTTSSSVVARMLFAYSRDCSRAPDGLGALAGLPACHPNNGTRRELTTRSWAPSPVHRGPIRNVARWGTYRIFVEIRI